MLPIRNREFPCLAVADITDRLAVKDDLIRSETVDISRVSNYPQKSQFRTLIQRHSCDGFSIDPTPVPAKHFRRLYSISRTEEAERMAILPTTNRFPWFNVGGFETTEAQ